MSPRKDLPDEVWYKCPDCDGEGSVDNFDDDDDFEDEVDEAGNTVAVRVRGSSTITCGTCDGLRVIEGDVNDMDLAESLGWERVDP